MEFKNPQRKKNSNLKLKLILPSKQEKEILGVFNGQCVTINDWDSMNYLYESGSFGKGTLSKGKPVYHITKDDISKIMVHHQFENHIKWASDSRVPENSESFHSQKLLEFVGDDLKLSLQSVSNFFESCFDDDDDDVKQETWISWKKKHNQKPESFSQKVNWPLMELKPDTSYYKDEAFSSLVDGILQSRRIKEPTSQVSTFKEVIVLNASYNFLTDNFFLANTNAVLKKLPFSPRENLSLSLEESFFLKSVLGCLNIVDLNFCEMAIKDMWEKFNSVDENFTARFIIYNYYRNKGWVVRSGLKFGGDYLLYKDGPSFYHASYLVKVLNRRKNLTWREFIAVNRLVETFNKDLLLCDVLLNNVALDEKTINIKSHSVQEVLVKRWFPSKERFTQESTSN